MKSGIYNWLLLGILIWNWVSSIRVIFKVIRGQIMLRNAQLSGDYVVKGISAVYSVKNYILAILFELAFTGWFIKLIISAGFSTYFTLLLIAFIIPGILNLLIHITAVFLEKHVYLTSRGLIYFLGCFEFSKCRFSWEDTGAAATLSNTLHAYKNKGKLPFTVVFDDDIDIAHKIINQNSMLM